jgi:phosphatidylglycerophosphate synthase
VVAGLALIVRPSIALVLFGVVTDWIDGAVARRGEPAPYGARFDLEADSVLTLGAAIAAARRGASRFLLVAPLIRYAVVAARDPRSYTTSELRWDRVSGIAQMAVLAAALSPWPVRALALAAGPVAAARCATLAALVMPGAVHSVSHMRPAEARLVHALRRGDR